MISSVMVIGSGGREHALLWKLGQESRFTRLIAAPGNDGMSPQWERWPCKLSSGSLKERRAEFRRLAKKAFKEKIDLVIVGPDNPLADGIIDEFNNEGVLTFGPKAAAAQIESSKAFAKEVMQAARVPTADFKIANTLEEAQKIIQKNEWPSGWVVKADGLALGKGVEVCHKREEAIAAAERLLPISGKIVIEECLEGEEVSWMAFCDGTDCSLLDPAQDHKRLLDGDQGPNTGGMGAYSPVPLVTAAIREKVRTQVFIPMLREMKKRGCEFRGLLFAGLMINFSTQQIYVLEFNARFGDPETQVLMARMQGSLADWCLACAQGRLGKLPKNVPFTTDSAVVVVGAAAGYPDQPKSGAVIQGGEKGWVFYAGVTRDSVDGKLKSSGGRVFGAMGVGRDLGSARDQAYQLIRTIRMEGLQYRKDIGQKGMM